MQYKRNGRVSWNGGSLVYFHIERSQGGGCDKKIKERIPHGRQG
jgi:hypothetical protein